MHRFQGTLNLDAKAAVHFEPMHCHQERDQFAPCSVSLSFPIFFSPISTKSLRMKYSHLMPPGSSFIGMFDAS